MIPNPHKFMEAAVEMFRKQSKIANQPSDPFKMGFDPTGFYSRGHCAEFAYVLADFAANKGIEPQITIMFRNRISEETNEIIDKRLSHCIVELDDKSYDICGDDARMSWFIKAGYACENDKGERSEWEFVSIPIGDRVEAYNQLESHCKRHDVAFSREQIEKDQAIFKSALIKDNNRESNLAL